MIMLEAGPIRIQLVNMVIRPVITATVATTMVMVPMEAAPQDMAR